MKLIIKKLKRYLEDLLILSGLIIIASTTFLISKIAGLYITGFILFALGVYFSKYPLEK